MRLTMTLLSTLALLIPAACAAGGSSPAPLACSTVALKTQVLPGEWFIMRFVVRNDGGSVVKVVGTDQWGTHKFRSRAVGEGWRDWGDWPPEGVPSGDPPFSELKPGEVVEKVHLLQPNWLHYPPGKYEAQLIIDYSRWPDFTKPPAGAWAGILECTPAQIEVVEPTGVDKEVFDARGPYPLSGGGKITIVEKYPTSIYAGYVLLGSFSFEVTPSSALLRGEDNRRGPASESAVGIAQRAHEIERDDRLARVLLSGLEAFLGAHPDFPLRSRLEAKRAGLLAYFERYDEARALAKKALAEEENPRWHKEGRRFLDLLVEKGYLKPE